MAQQTTKEPLYKVLNEQRTQGDWFNEYDNDDFGQFYTIFGGEGDNALRFSYGSVKEKEYKANAEYVTLSVNNLHILAEALAGFIHSVEHEGVIQGRVVDAVANAKEALKAIS